MLQQPTHTEVSIEQMRKYWCSLVRKCFYVLLCTVFYINVREGMPKYEVKREYW